MIYRDEQTISASNRYTLHFKLNSVGREGIRAEEVSTILTGLLSLPSHLADSLSFLFPQL